MECDPQHRLDAQVARRFRRRDSLLPASCFLPPALCYLLRDAGVAKWQTLRT